MKEACLQNLKRRMKSLIEISETDLEIITRHFECRSLKKNQMLLREGASCDMWGFVNCGLLRIYSHKSNGEEYTNWFLREGEFFSEFVSFFKQAPSLENFVALEDTEIAILNASTLQKLTDRYPVFDKFVRLVYQETIITIKEDMLHKIHLNAQDRYLYLLQTRPDIVRRVPLKHIASYIDITESSLSRIRRKIIKTE